MLIQRNEGKACDAVVRHIEACTGDTRKSLRHPETDHEGPPVDLRLKVGAQEYAIEHTLLQMYPNMIKYVAAFNTIHKFVGKRISGPLPGAVHYELHVPIKVSFPRGKKHRERALHSLVEWILSSAQRLHERRWEVPPALLWVNNSIRAIPNGFEHEFELFRWPDGLRTQRKPGALGMRFSAPEDIEHPLRNVLAEAFAKKFPKLQDCKVLGARTVLVLESIDPPFWHYRYIGNHLPKLLTQRTDPPDEIYLVEPHPGEFMWCVWPVKRDEQHWPAVGMPQRGRPYFPLGQSPPTDLPIWHRHLNTPFEMWPPIPLEWSPAFFKEEELHDLTRSQAKATS